ncbi:hypothetical protein HYD_4490 [Candidatus Hydrogenosomobacter endosymbioticus]|uniref:Uncharacterized protein n=1 Tax=Candidatus Hydrogenosomobacter endosymbioticus TaxID=2558174 RepID=A0ABM7V9W8_9PROT|nr:hypothetical protein HYD_4490 [Candidatus Hydrogenosomobacter endosymbioticus]
MDDEAAMKARAKNVNKYPVIINGLRFLAISLRDPANVLIRRENPSTIPSMAPAKPLFKLQQYLKKNGMQI